MNRTAILTIIFASLWNTCLLAQESSELTKKELILGVNISGNSYYGDINFNPNGGFLSANTYLNVNPGVHFTFRQNQPNYLSMVLTGGYAQILAQNPDLAPFYYGDPADPRSLYVAPRYVSTDYIYGDVNLRFTPVRKVRALMRPYIQTGVGGLLFFPLKNGTVRPKGANLERGESFSTISGSANAMIGADINFSKHASLNLGTQLRLPMTDYMDWYGGKNVNSFRKQGGDFIFTIMVGANFKIFETNRPTIFQPRILNNLHQEKLPEDSIVLASNDEEYWYYLLSKKNDEPYNYYASLVYPEDWTPLAVLAKSIDCDSLARIADQRISVLYAENLQLRAQYTKIENKTNNSPSIANNNGDEELKRMMAEAQAEAEMAKMQTNSMKAANQTLLDKVSELESKVMAMQLDNENKSNPAPTSTAGNEDSLIRVIAQKEHEIEQLQELLKQGTQTTTLAGSEKMAELEKENLTLKAENEKLREGNNDISETPGFVELQQRYNAVLVQNENLQKDLDTEKENNQVLVARLEQGHNNDINAEGAANNEIDSLKRETLTLYTEITNLANSQSIKDSLAQIELEGVEAQLAAANEKIAVLESAPIGNPAETEGIQAALAEALEKKNETDAKYAELQANINSYETQIVATKQSNDSLLVVVQNLQATSTSPSPTPVSENASVREMSLMAELEEVRSVALKAQEDKNMAEENLTAAKIEIANLNERVADLQGNGSAAYATEFQIARNRIDSLQRITEEQASRLMMGDPTGSAPVVASSVYQNMQAQLEAANKDVNDLKLENQELKQAVANLSVANDASAVRDMRAELDAVKRENENLITVNESQKTRIADLEEKANNNLPIIPVPTNEGGGDSTEIAALKLEVEGLQKDKEALVNRNGEMQNEINRLEGVIAEKESNPTNSQPVGTGTAISQEEFDKMKQSVDIFTAENSELKKENERLQTLNNAYTNTDPDERTLQIQQLENENTLLRQQVTKFAMLNAEMADMQNKILELETENKNLKAIAGGTPSDAAINGQLAEKEDEISALQTQLADITAKYDAQKHEYDLLVEAQKVDKSAELQAKVEEMTTSMAGLEARVSALTSENDSLINNNPGAQLAALTTQVDELRGSNAELLKKLNDTEDKLIAGEDAMNGLRKAYEEVSARIPNPEAAAQQEQQIAALNAQLQEANTKIAASAELDTQITTLKAQLSENEITESALKSEIVALNDTINVQKNLLQNNRPAGAEELAVMAKEIERLNEELKNRPLNEEALRQIADLQEDNNRKQAEIERLSANGGISSEEIKAQFAALEDENKQLKQEVERLQGLGNPVSEQVADLQKQLLDAQDEKSGLLTEIQRLKVGGNPDSAMIADLQAQLAALETENKQKQTQIDQLVENGTNPAQMAELQAQVTQLNGQLAEKDAKNEQLTSQVQTLNTSVADLTEQLSKIPAAAELAILQKENERLNNELKNRPTGTDETAQARIVSLENDNERLAAQVNDLNKRIEEMGVAGGSAAIVAEMNAVITQKEEENLALRKELENAPSMEEYARIKVELDEYKNDKPIVIPTDATSAQVAQLQADKEQLIQEVAKLNGLLNEGVNPNVLAEKDAEIAALNEKLANVPNAEEMASLKVRNESLTAQIEEQDNQILKMSEEIASLEENNEAAPLLTEIEVLKKELAERPDVTTYQVQIQNLTAENDRLKKEMENRPMENNSEALIADLKAQIDQQKAEIDVLKANPNIDNDSKAIIANLEAKLAEKDAQIAQLQNGGQPESGTTEMIAALNLQIEQQKAEIVTLKANQIDATTVNIVAERDAVRQQNEELFNENDDYRNALGNALAAMEELRKGSRMPSPELEEKNQQLVARVSELEGELEVAKRNTGGSDGEKLAALEAQLSSALASNDKLQKELEIAKSMDNPTDNEEILQLKSANSDLQSQIATQATQVDNLSQENKSLQTQVAQQTEIITEKEQIIAAHQQKIDELESEINDLRKNINIKPIATNDINSAKRIDSLKMVIAGLRTQMEVINQNSNLAPVTAGNNVSMSQQQLNQKVAEIEAREKRSKAREEYIESLNLDYQLQVEKGKYLNAKEIELQILSQKLSGFPDYFAEITQDGAPCSTVSASLDKQEVMERINSYFNTLGYKFRTSNGKMIFENVTIPEISKKPVNVVFYMMTSKSGKRIFQGVFQFVDNKNYITADRYPNETTRALKLMQRLSQQ